MFAVALPLWSTGHWNASATEMTRVFVAAVVVDVLVIPWSYVLTHYVKKPGDPWKVAGVFRKVALEPTGRT